MSKQNPEYQKYLEKAYKNHSDSISFIGKAIVLLAKEKGFGDYSTDFNCCFASGNETIVTFMDSLEDREMSFEEFESLDKKQICKEFLDFSNQWYTSISPKVEEILTKIYEEA